MPARGLNLTVALVYEWAYRYSERVGILCENRIPSAAIKKLAEQEANEWLSQELAYAEVDQELAF